MPRGAFLLLLCFGCQTYYLIPEKTYQEAKKDPDPAHVAMRAMRLPGSSCSVGGFNSVSTGVKLQEMEIDSWLENCNHCIKIRNRMLISGITLLAIGVASTAGAFAMQYSDCGDADCEKRRPGAVGGLALLAVLGGLTGSILTPLGIRDARQRPWEISKDTPGYHYYEAPTNWNQCRAGTPSLARAH
jgi:hypothetical protein